MLLSPKDGENKSCAQRENGHKSSRLLKPDPSSEGSLQFNVAQVKEQASLKLLKLPRSRCAVSKKWNPDLILCKSVDFAPPAHGFHPDDNQQHVPHLKSATMITGCERWCKNLCEISGIKSRLHNSALPLLVSP